MKDAGWKTILLIYLAAFALAAWMDEEAAPTPTQQACIDDGGWVGEDE